MCTLLFPFSVSFGRKAQTTGTVDSSDSSNVEAHHRLHGVVEPQKWRNSCPQLPLLGLSLKGQNNVFTYMLDCRFKQ